MTMRVTEIKEGVIYEGCNGTQKIVESIIDDVVNWHRITPPKRYGKPGKESGSNSLKTFAGWAYQKVQPN
jgi:hypothetical protein